MNLADILIMLLLCAGTMLGFLSWIDKNLVQYAPALHRDDYCRVCLPNSGKGLAFRNPGRQLADAPGSLIHILYFWCCSICSFLVLVCRLRIAILFSRLR